jgi:hypothetical protein
MTMKQLIANEAGHIIIDIDGKRMLVDTGAARSFHDEYQGVHVTDLSRLMGVSLDGVLGMDGLQGKVMTMGKNRFHLDQAAPEHIGAPLTYPSGIPCVDIKINEIPCVAAIKTGVTSTYLSEELISRDKPSRLVDEIHPLSGPFKVETFVNYFSINDKDFFADASVLPDEYSLRYTAAIDVIIGTDLLNRFELTMDFADNRLHLLSR